MDIFVGWKEVLFWVEYYISVIICESSVCDKDMYGQGVD